MMNGVNDGHSEPRGEARRVLHRRTLSCAVISLALAVAVFTSFGFNLWTALIVLVFLVCPVTMIWVVITGSRPIPFPVGPIPKTRGYTLDWLAPYYDLVCRVFGIGPSFRVRTLALANLRQGDHVLDVGCGTGVLTRLAANAVGPNGTAVGVDPAGDMIRVARQNATMTRNSAQFTPGAIEDLPFESGSFDIVFASLVLHHLPPELIAPGLAEVRRVLKPGGRLVVVELDQPQATLWWIVLWPLIFSSEAMEHLRGRTEHFLHSAGFAGVVRSGRWCGLLSFWVARKPAEPRAS